MASTETVSVILKCERTQDGGSLQRWLDALDVPKFVENSSSFLLIVSMYKNPNVQMVVQTCSTWSQIQSFGATNAKSNPGRFETL